MITVPPPTFSRQDLVPFAASARPPAAVHKRAILGLCNADNGVHPRIVGDEGNRQASTGHQVLVGAWLGKDTCGVFRRGKRIVTHNPRFERVVADLTTSASDGIFTRSFVYRAKTAKRRRAQKAATPSPTTTKLRDVGSGTGTNSNSFPPRKAPAFADEL